MKVAKAEQHVLGSEGLTETSSFKIRTNAQAFQILSSGLYSDKIAAVLREIGCNAADAHTQYGLPDKPIIVKLPNRIDNQFYIRDMGPGLSHDDVMDLYTTYFASTKRDSNDYTGAFGLGSKSPFSYTDSFSVTSVHNGVKRSYSAYLDNKGSPTISKLAESAADIDWPHGVEISFPVKYDDFNSFESRAQNIFRWFKVKPQVEGVRPIQDVLPTVDHPLYGLYKGNLNGNSHGVLMGNVFYPLDILKLQPTGFANHLRYFTGIVFKLNIGDIQVAASREELQYDPASREFLNKRAEEVLTFIGTTLADKLRTAKSWEEKCQAKLWGDAWGNVDLEGLFKSLNFPDASHLAGISKGRQVDAPKIMGVNSDARLINTNAYKRTGSLRPDFTRIIGGLSYSKISWRSGQTIHIPLHKETKIFYGDKNLSLIRAGEAVRLGAAQVLLFTPDVENKKTLADAQAEAEAVAKELGITAIADIVTIPLPVTYTKPIKKVKLKKGATLPPLPSMPVMVVQTASPTENKNISTLGPEFHNFMVRARTGGWNRRNDKMRVYASTAETDKMYELDTWNEIWTNASIVGRVVKTPFRGYVEFIAADVSKLDIVKRGWKTADQAVHEWLADPTTSDEIVKAAKNWLPSIQLGYRENHWAGYFIFLKHTGADGWFDKFKPHLDKIGILDSVERIHKQSVKQGQQAGKAEPPVLTAYRTLASNYKLPAITVTKSGAYLSIEDFNNDIEKKFELAATMEVVTFHNMITASPNKATDLLKTIFS